MSWDITVQDLPANAKSIEDIPEDFVPKPLGKRSCVIENIKAVIPSIDFSDPSWGRYSGKDFSIEFNMGSKEICDGFMLHVRGGGDVIIFISHLLNEMRLRAIDCGSGDFFTSDSAQDSLSNWQGFRDRVIDETNQK